MVNEKQKFTLTKSCAVHGCIADCSKRVTNMYLIPQELNPNIWSKSVCDRAKLRRESWLTNIKCTTALPTKAYICQYHFILGKQYNNTLFILLKLINMTGKPSKPTETNEVDWSPTLFLPEGNIRNDSLNSIELNNGINFNVVKH